MKQNKEPSQYVMQGIRAIEQARKRSDKFVELHDQIEKLGKINAYDKEKIELYMKGKINQMDVGGEEKIADYRVLLAHERENVPKRSEESQMKNMSPKYDRK